MTSWATITLRINEDIAPSFTGPPTGLKIDSGNDEYGWIDDETVCALSYGRYQHKRYEEHVDDFASSWFNGVEVAVVCDVENTGDNVEADIYKPRQRRSDDIRADGMDWVASYEGKRWPEEDRRTIIERISSDYGIEPAVEPVETTTPPDMVLRKS